ncbi:MAG: hypothetical protein K0Q49_2249 [Haloplasmataceae bacterium]|jgi:hypothetical protein|nr:hypothetical protein [Haloplasmataceae bacterium]
MLNPIEEIYFWSSIMSDHGEFILTLMSPRETEFIKKANYFKTEWTKIHNEAEVIINASDTINATELVNKSVLLLKDFIEFKKIILGKLLKCEISFNQVPSFVNHMLNEANEFYRNLYLATGNKKMNPYDETILLHKLWLRDASGHAAAVSGSLDPVEAILVKEACDFKDKFDNLYIKAYELGLMIERTQVESKAILYLNEEVNQVLTDFICFLDRVKNLRIECKVMGYIVPEMVDHMIREEKYYLAKVKKIL